jgi:hypothetical protein
MTVVLTNQGTKVRTESRFRFILLAETVEAHREFNLAGFPIVVTGVRGARVEKRAATRAPLEAHIRRHARGLGTGPEFTEFTLVDTRS